MRHPPVTTAVSPAAPPAPTLDGLPLADLAVPGMAEYRDMVFGGWDLDGSDLAAAAAGHPVVLAVLPATDQRSLARTREAVR